MYVHTYICTYGNVYVYTYANEHTQLQGGYLIYEINKATKNILTNK